VPSRHDYAEGLPNTLCEALASRTPVVFSDHPAFASRLQADRDGVIFRAGDPAALAQAVQRLRATPDLQRRLSESAPEALASLRFGMDWGALIRQYLDDPTDKTDWVAQNSLPRLLAHSPDQQS
jgi:glycosyltransferase involved in cell wall biosynthesis